MATKITSPNKNPDLQSLLGAYYGIYVYIYDIHIYIYIYIYIYKIYGV